jgi:hypothetical protein
MERAMENPYTSKLSRLMQVPGRCAAGISAFSLGITVAAMAMAQQQNIYMQSEKTRFHAAPKTPDPEAAEAAAQAPDMILGIEANTIFFVAAGVVAVFWFGFSGGRKAKITGQQS